MHLSRHNEAKRPRREPDGSSRQIFEEVDTRHAVEVVGQREGQQRRQPQQQHKLLCVCMCVGVCIWMSIYNVHTFIDVYRQIHECIYAHTYLQKHTHTHTHTHSLTHSRTHTHTLSLSLIHTHKTRRTTWKPRREMASSIARNLRELEITSSINWRKNNFPTRKAPPAATVAESNTMMTPVMRHLCYSPHGARCS